MAWTARGKNKRKIKNLKREEALYGKPYYKLKNGTRVLNSWKAVYCKTCRKTTQYFHACKPWWWGAKNLKQESKPLEGIVWHGDRPEKPKKRRIKKLDL